MKEKKAELLKLMKEYKMNKSTITGVMKLLQSEEDIQKTINYIKRQGSRMNDYQLRQYMAMILLWDKEE